jgi:hypothetical protein
MATVIAERSRSRPPTRGAGPSGPRRRARYLREALDRVGAIVAGRRLFDIGRWGEHGHPFGVPVFVVTHSVPAGWPRETGVTHLTYRVRSRRR